MRATPLSSAVYTRMRVATAINFGGTATVEPDDTATGITVTLPGGAATIDPGDAVWRTWDARDIFGKIPDGDDLFPWVLSLHEVTAPPLADDSYVAIGLCNENDLDTVTVDAIGMAIVYQTAGRTARALRILNGTVSVSDDGTPAGALRRLVGNSTWIAGPSNNGWGRIQPMGLSDAGAPLNPIENINYQANVTFGAGPLFVFMAWGRTSADATAVAMETDGHYTMMPRPLGGFAP